MVITTDYAVASLRMPACPAAALFQATVSQATVSQVDLFADKLSATGLTNPANGEHKFANRPWATPPPRARMQV